MEGMHVPPELVQAFLDPAEGWVRPDRASVDELILGYAKKVGAGKVHVDAFLNKLRNPKAVGNAPLDDVARWVEVLASAVETSSLDYGNRFAYGGFNLKSAYPMVGLNTWNPPTDTNMTSDGQSIRAAASSPAADTQFALGTRFVCMTKVWENAFVASVFDGRNVDLCDVGGKAPVGHPSFNECPGYKAADASKYPGYFDLTEFPPEPVNFGSYPPDASLGATAYVLTSGAYPILSVNGKGPSLRKLALVKELGGVFKKLDDASARELGSRYGLNGIEYAEKEYWGLFTVFMPNKSQTAGHLMLIILNPQFGSTMGGAFGGGSGVHAELLFILKTQAEVIRSLSDCGVLPINRAHPLWQLVGDLGMRPVFDVARKMSVVDARGERYETRHVRAGAAGGATGASEATKAREGYGPNETKHSRGGAADASEDTKAREGYGPNETKHSRAGAAFAVRDFPKITCPFCRTINVRLNWTGSRDTVTYRHSRSCVDGKSKQQTIHINEEEVWRAFLHELQPDEFDKHKADVLS